MELMMEMGKGLVVYNFFCLKVGNWCSGDHCCLVKLSDRHEVVTVVCHQMVKLYIQD